MNEAPSGVVVLTARHATNYALVHAIAASVGIDHVVFEGFRTWRMIPYRLKKLGWRAVAGQLLFLAWDGIFVRPRARLEVAKLLEGYDVSPPDGSVPATDVERINAPEVETLLRELRPRVVIVSGTGILSKRLLALAPAFINIHAGITPRYRGVHGGFWAIYEGLPEPPASPCTSWTREWTRARYFGNARSRSMRPRTPIEPFPSSKRSPAFRS